MGIKFMAMAIEAKTANSGQKLVLLMLANHCNDHTRQCNPSQKLLAEECSMGLSTLKNHINALEEAGYIETISVYKDNIQRPNQYILKLSSSQNLATPQPESDRPPSQNLATEPELKTRIEPSRKATRLPDDFVVPDEWKAWAKSQRPDLQVQVVADSFVDYWIARGDAGACKTNWLATWRNWVRNSKGSYVKPMSASERATNIALGRPADYRMLTPEEQAERLKRIAMR